jgi:adenosylcobinamide kinase/adenosylcobinamide-phosphate guanylyltransferase
MNTSKAGLTFVIGGARSGKSSYAVELASSLGCPTLYVATAEGLDPEMKTRIRRHRAGRPQTWRTLEEPLEFTQRIAAEAGAGSTVIVDCLTVWLGNLLERYVRDASKPRVAETKQVRRQALAELRLLCNLPQQQRLNIIVISNEVGAGLVPPTPLGRVYRDLLGEVNQFVAGRADRVVLLVAGITVDLKSLTREEGQYDAVNALLSPAHGSGDLP